MKHDKIDYTLPYERRYWPGMIVPSGEQNNDTTYRVVSYRPPAKNDLFIDAFVVRSDSNNFTHPPLWIVEEVQNYEIKTCTRIWDDSVSRYVDIDPFKIRVYNERPKDEAMDSGYSYINGLHYVLPEYPRSFAVNIDWKRCEFVNGNPLQTEEYKFYRHYVNKYHIGQVITFKSKQYKITAFEPPKDDQLCLMAEFNNYQATYIMSGISVGHTSHTGKYGNKRYIVEPVPVCSLTYEKAYSDGQIVTDIKGKTWRVVAYRCVAQAEFFISYASTPSEIEILQCERFSDSCRWVVEAAWTYENGFTPGQVVTSRDDMKWRVVRYDTPGENEPFIGQTSTESNIMLFYGPLYNFGSNYNGGSQKRWVVKPVVEETEEEKFKNKWRKATPYALALQLTAPNLSYEHRRWLINVVEERCK